MNKLNIKLVTIALVMPISFSAWATNNANGLMPNKMMGDSICQLDVNQIQIRSLAQPEIDVLKFMREEEKLARDVYQVFFENTSATVFNNISQSEQKHMDQVKLFLDAYEIEDPAKTNEGEFTDLSLQALYDQLLEQGAESDLAAYNVGALIEEVDIKDLDAAIEDTDIPELINMYTQLRDASYNHLRAFTRQIIMLDGSYTSQVLDQQTVDSILNTANTKMQIGNAIRVNGTEESASSACFISNLKADEQILQNGSSIPSSQIVNISYQVKADVIDIGQTVDWVLLANYGTTDGPSNWFVRDTDQWKDWNGQVADLPAAETGYVLQSEQTIPVFNGTLDAMPGTYTIYIGYRLEDDSLVYKQSPLVFSIIP
ncbi:hypothetical protein AU255_08190 [Methyloprofundus sedimenti]|uniref:DUF2202 domain-containing protein n=1 Tax=Methyloprofundus sedimenti TaxID=1420851 RepID=A0A1V8M8H3_9GAMM|nr:DUF2202 domain-containing protein [Methyloprofundus sedimenti]OQK17829.1 hypothetical protein AU255_08190 [Methyloprofundus sedimenti]